MVKDQIKDTIYGDGKPGAAWLQMLLRAASVVYRQAVGMRAGAYRYRLLPTRRLPCKVISIGNLTLGGTGKTPFAMTVAPMLRAQHLNVAVISRGYKSRYEKKGGIVSDGAKVRLGPQDAGDEPFLLAKHLLKHGIPVLIGGDRYRTGCLAVNAFNPQVLLLDDGFQHIRLARDIDLVLLDSLQPFGNGFVFPRGSLREPVAGLRRADAIVFTRSDQIGTEDRGGLQSAMAGLLGEKPVFFTRHQPFIAAMSDRTIPQMMPPADRSIEPLRALQGKKIFAFSGIARNDAFRQTLSAAGGQIVDFHAFEDHHRYRPDELAAVVASARQSGADIMATTEKDFVRLADGFDPGMKLAVIGVRIQFTENQQPFNDFIIHRLNINHDLKQR